MVGLAALGALAFFFMRDTWEADNRAALLELRRDAQAARGSVKKLAYQKYDAIVQRVGNRNLRDRDLQAAYEEAKAGRSALMAEMAAQEQADSDARAKGITPVKTPNDMKAVEAAYVKYEEKSRPLLDAFGHTKALIEVGADVTKYTESVGEMKAAYDKWYDALSAAETHQPSALLMKVVLDSYKEASDWWTIQTQKKMPEAQYAEMLRRNLWSQADNTVSRIKRCMEAKDIIEKKRCAPCDGGGKLKCVYCLGSGICPVCKGDVSKQVLKCCTGGVCDACKGRKESICPICNGEGTFPRK